MKAFKWIYWVGTVLLSILLLFSAGMYLLNTPQVEETFRSLGFPTWLIIPLGIAKILAVAVMFLVRKSVLRDLAYAGLFFDFLLAMFAHFMVDDGQHLLAISAMIFLIMSYVGWKKMNEVI
jgi:hypothetical protein